MDGRVPTVSIAMPVYNGEKFLGEAIHALLDQTYRDFELIITDNGSTDRTPLICRYFAARDARIRYFRHETNRGAAWNFNFGFKQARGEYFRWAAADDLCLPEYLRACVDVLDAHPDVAWVHTRHARIDGDGRPLPLGPPRDVDLGGPATRTAAEPHQRLRALLTGSVGNGGVFGLMRRDVAAKTRLQLPFYGADKVFVVELALRGRFEEVPRVLFHSRHHEQGSGALRNAAELQRFIDPLAKASALRTRLRLLCGHTTAVCRAPLSPLARMRCFGVIGAYLFQISKWRRIIDRTLRGMGNGGGYTQSVASEH
jgi:glycosyltransferase involved in cell wall biosynthesis